MVPLAGEAGGKRGPSEIRKPVREELAEPSSPPLGPRVRQPPGETPPDWGRGSLARRPPAPGPLSKWPCDVSLLNSELLALDGRKEERRMLRPAATK